MEYDKNLKNRLSRIEGQIRGVLRMMENEKECKDVIPQLSAVRSGLDRVIALAVSSNLESCVRKQYEGGKRNYEYDDLVEESVKLLLKSR